jgi:hypothetical protein
MREQKRPLAREPSVFFNCLLIVQRLLGAVAKRADLSRWRRNPFVAVNDPGYYRLRTGMPTNKTKIASAMAATITPYCIVVAPLSSRLNFRNTCIGVLLAVARAAT